MLRRAQREGGGGRSSRPAEARHAGRGGAGRGGAEAGGVAVPGRGLVAAAALPSSAAALAPLRSVPDGPGAPEGRGATRAGPATGGEPPSSLRSHAGQERRPATGKGARWGSGEGCALDRGLVAAPRPFADTPFPWTPLGGRVQGGAPLQGLVGWRGSRCECNGRNIFSSPVLTGLFLRLLFVQKSPEYECFNRKKRVLRKGQLVVERSQQWRVRNHKPDTGKVTIVAFFTSKGLRKPTLEYRARRRKLCRGVYCESA